jgi:hypothetical protein
MKDAIERSTLLKEKVNELKDIFADETIPINSLRELKFSYNEIGIIDFELHKDKNDESIEMTEPYSSENEKTNNKKKDEEKINE